MNEVDKYEYNLKLEEIDKLVDQRDYEEAARLADTIDWKRVRNVRTLCLVSEIYEAAGRPEDSKTLLERAYRRSPVGRTVLYRLVEVTILLRQYDEAMEYYTEYINVAPNDTNRFILKYRICRGRGDSPEELIPILEEYASLEYTEQWTYELAKLYQQAGQIQKCLAMCDDLVLWFHSGKYVIKALELKKKYARLTPKQEEIYNEQFVRPVDTPEKEEQPDGADDMLTSVASEVNSEVIAATIIASTEKEIAGEVAAHKAELEQAELEQTELEQAEPDQEERKAEENDRPAAADGGESQEELDLQAELAKSMREIIAGVAKRSEEPEEQEEEEEPEEPVAPKELESIPQAEPSGEPEYGEGKLSIDDILLSMGEKGRALAQSARSAQESVDESGLTGAQKEALQYSSNPEKSLANKRSLPTYEEPKEKDDEEEKEDFQNTRRRDYSREELREGILKEKTIRVPTDKIASLHARYGVGELWEEQARLMRESEEEFYKAGSKGGAVYRAEKSGMEVREYEEDEYYEVDDPDEIYEMPEEAAGEPEEEIIEGTGRELLEEPYTKDGPAESEEIFAKDAGSETEKPEDTGEDGAALTGEENSETKEKEEGRKTGPKKEGPLLPDHIRGFFEGFTEIEGLEQQIANAVLQAAGNGGDRTSRTGNILIFGPHGSGKTTLAVNIARAIAQDRGSDTLKLAKIYAADFNRKDIAATVARIAGGTLIIEEAGDLDPNAIEQLTTAMEFRTDGMLVILEDEQQYIHDLLMSHPRFTMKFTAQIYLPVYTAQELVMFAQLYADSQDYVISEEGREVLYDKISSVAEQGNNVSIANVTELVSHAISRSNKLLRKMVMGRKRYDENDFIILYAKDFK